MWIFKRINGVAAGGGGCDFTPNLLPIRRTTCSISRFSSFFFAIFYPPPLDWYRLEFVSPSEKIMKPPSLSFGLLTGHARHTVISPAAMQISIDPARRNRERERERERERKREKTFISFQSSPLYSSFLLRHARIARWFFLSVCRLFARSYVCNEILLICYFFWRDGKIMDDDRRRRFFLTIR